MAYNTKQQSAILHCLEQYAETAVTAAALAEALHAGGCSVGLATVYRQLEKLAQTGRVHKINTEEGALYQYCAHPDAHERDCFLLRCHACGSIVHLDCDHLQELCSHIAAEHGFRVDPHHTILSGLCAVCAGKESAHEAI